MSFIKTSKAYSKLIFSFSKTFFQMLKGVRAISNLSQPPITIFGGSKLKQESSYMKDAYKLAHMIGKEDIPVLTGGGPGIMKAANCGLLHEKIASRNIALESSVGITVKGLDENGTLNSFNCCAITQITMEHFFSRKWLLMRYSIGFVIFPGGFGTMDELFEILTLIQTQKYKAVPVILIGTDYWMPLITWMENTMLKQGLITQHDTSLYTITDDLNEALNILVKFCKKC